MRDTEWKSGNKDPLEWDQFEPSKENKEKLVRMNKSNLSEERVNDLVNEYIKELKMF